MVATDTAATRGPVWAAYLFLLSLLVAIHLKVGTVVLMPHRIILLVLFVPFFLKLFVLRSSGPVRAFDWLLFASALWAGVALVVNHPVSMIVEPFGIHMLEFFGAYLIARVSIRSAAAFRRVVVVFFVMICLLLPFAAVESITHRPVLLEILPGTSVLPLDIGVRMGMRRAQAVFAHPILYGIFVSTGLGLFWYALRPRWLKFPAVPIVAVATIFSLSTGALISLVVQSIFIGWETIMKTLKLRWRLFLVLFAIAYVGIDLLSNRSPFHVLVSYASFNSGSAYGRILIWRFGIDNVWENPVFGLGLRDWVRPSWKSPSIDNFWLFLAMFYGLPKFALVFTAFFQIVRQVARTELTDPGDQLARAGYLVAFGGLFIAGGTVHYWHAMMAFVMFIFGSGVWTVTGGAVQTDRHREMPPDAPRASRYTRQPVRGEPIGAATRGTVYNRQPLARSGDLVTNGGEGAGKATFPRPKR